jgi:hypothetical protein
MSNVLQRSGWLPEFAKRLETTAMLQRAAQRDPGRTVTATIEIWSHQFGWELKLFVDGGLVRSQVGRELVALTAAAAEWHTAMISEGWRASEPAVADEGAGIE